MNETKTTPGPWRWQGEDYRAGWGWMMLVGPNGEGLIVGQGEDGGVSPHLKAFQPVDPALCVTGLAAIGKERAACVHVFGEGNARLIVAAPDLLKAAKRAFAVLTATGQRQEPTNVIGALAKAIALAEGKS